MGLKGIVLKFGGSITRFCLKRRNTVIGNNVVINGTVDLFGKGNIVIGNNVVINSAHIANPSGGNKTTFYVLPGAKLSIGDYVGISNATFCCTNEIEIYEYVTIGAGCTFYDTDFHPLSYMDRRNKTGDIKTRKISIRKDAFIGANSIVLKGSTIGERSIIGAGSVVNGNIPTGEVWAGNPCRFIRKIEMNCETD